MNALVLNAHHDDPHWAIPSDRESEVDCFNEAIDDFSCLVAMAFDFGWSWPIIIGFV